MWRAGNSADKVFVLNRLHDRLTSQVQKERAGGRQRVDWEGECVGREWDVASGLTVWLTRVAGAIDRSLRTYTSSF